MPLSSAENALTIRREDLKAIIFDFDGTLVDSEPVWKSVIVDIFEKECSITPSSDFLWKNSGVGTFRCVRNVDAEYNLDLNEAELAQLHDSILENVHRRIVSDLDFRPGLHELLEWTQQQNITTSICTASTHDLITTYLEKRNMIDSFSPIISTAQFPEEKKKPHPYPYEYAMAESLSTRETTIIIEDSPIGITSARAAGAPTIAVYKEELSDAQQQADPTFLVEDFHQVLALLSDLP